MTIARCIAMLLGAFTLINLTAGLRGGFDANVWWIDTRAMGAVGDVLLLAGACFMLAWVAKPTMGSLRRRVTLGCMGLLVATAMVNTITVFWLASQGQITMDWPVPISAIVSVVLAWLGLSMRGRIEPGPLPWPARLVMAAVAGGLLVVMFPLAQMGLYGKTDYRQPAGAIVVFGAKAYADGSLSLALADRVRTACDLYHEGLAEYLILSGGPGEGDIDEPTAMRNYAMNQGVPAEAIILDPRGLNTAATLDNCQPLFESLGVNRAIAVSHFYHLPRIKLASQQRGLNLLTVPADESRTLVGLPYYLAREVAAWWYYYLRALA